MDEPFPVLTNLCVRTFEIAESAVVAELPDSFLGGSAPRLQVLVLEGAAFPALPNLVLSASHFHYLRLRCIPHARYILPEAMVTFLLPLHNLKGLTIGFISSQSRPSQMSPPPLTRVLLPSLTAFRFNGTSKYLMDFIAQIDTPMLDSFQMTFFLDVIPNISQLHRFIDRTDRLKTFIQAKVYLRPWDVQTIFKSPANLGLDITCDGPVSDGPLSSMLRLYEQLLTIPTQVEWLELYKDDMDELTFSIEQDWHKDLDDSRWLQLLNPFVSVKSLYVSKTLGPFVTYALANLCGESITGLLPALDHLFFDDFGSSWFVQKTVKEFVFVCQFTGHPVIVQHWEQKTAPG